MKKGIKKYDSLLCGVGFSNGNKYSKSINRTHTKVYKVWKSMLERCYSVTAYKNYSSYIGCSVHPDWHNFQVFAEWFEKSYEEEWALDKDILKKGNKIYSSENCMFVPKEINGAFVKRDKSRGDLPLGVYRSGDKFSTKISKYGKRLSLGTFNTSELAFEAYKIAKEIYIKELANKYKDQITEPCYQALINYKIEITD